MILANLYVLFLAIAIICLCDCFSQSENYYNNMNLDENSNNSGGRYRFDRNNFNSYQIGADYSEGEVTYYNHPEYKGEFHTAKLSRHRCHNVLPAFIGPIQGISSVHVGENCAKAFKEINCGGEHIWITPGHCDRDNGYKKECLDDDIRSIKLC